MGRIYDSRQCPLPPSRPGYKERHVPPKEPTYSEASNQAPEKEPTQQDKQIQNQTDNQNQTGGGADGTEREPSG